VNREGEVVGEGEVDRGEGEVIGGEGEVTEEKEGKGKLFGVGRGEKTEERRRRQG
jgi:hypothetical protein